MRLSLIITALFFLSLSLHAQNYMVIHVNGKIEKTSTKKLITRGSSLAPKEKLNYLTQGARAVVVDRQEGKRMILQNSNTGQAEVQSNLAPSMGNISSRGGALLNRLDVKNYFQGKFAIIETLKVPVNAQVFPQSDTQFFFIQMVYLGETINKKLNYSGDTLLINKDSLLQVDQKPIKNEDVTDMQLMYFSNVNGNITTSKISDTFYPVFPDTTQLNQEVELLLNTLPDHATLDKLDFVVGYIQDAYGKTRRENIEVWFNQYFVSKL
jgi:hypothetical protein